ncbi:choline ABC transporter ATP-binding protein [Stappia sp.]|uniref:choline ABC transporter ATP-binding protein n=1 Tax=Stappia sp. TaxID=1870903 RepID=UPI003A9A04F2
MSAPIVTFKNVDIVFGEHPESALPLVDAGRTRAEIQEETGQILGVAGASLDINEGELIVLMGLSGSGKSTLLRAVNGLNRITRGEVLVRDGEAMVNPSSCPPEELRRLRRGRIAMVFQNFALLPWRTVRENVGFGLELAGMPARERREKVDAQLDLVSLGQWGDKYVHELSGGMQQRVGLARAFATEAPILLMDEPFSALDPLIRGHLQDELLALQEKLDKTIIFVSHDLDEAAKIGSRIAIMEGGRVIQVGTPQQIVRKPANDYVSEFVAHMNPLGVLRARDIMRSMEEGTPSSLDDCPRCAPKTPVREVIALKRGVAEPVLVCEGDMPVGLVGEAEILDCLR